MAGTVKLLAFAGARDAIGASELELALPDLPDGEADVTTAADVLEQVCARFPALSAWRGCLRVAVNGAYAAPTDAVVGGDEVAIIPPVAGG